MKPILYILSLLILNLTLFSQWEMVNEGLGRDLSYIQFISEDVGWISGYETLLRTVNGGESWTAANPHPEDWYLDHFRFANVTQGWANGYWYSDDRERRSLLRTTDGGNTWAPAYDLPGNYDCRDIALVDDSIVYVVGCINETDYCSGFVLRTLNGGNNWEEISPQTPLDIVDLDQVHFMDRDLGVATGYCDTTAVVLITSDGGISWQQRLTNAFESIIKMQLLNDSTAWFIVRGHDHENKLCTTSDTFKTCTIRQPPDKSTRTFFAFPDGNTIFLAAQDSLSTYILKSSDAGLSWEVKQKLWIRDYSLGSPFLLRCTTTALGASSMVFTSDNQGFLMGSSLYFKTADGGENWDLQNINLSISGLFQRGPDELLICGSRYGRSHCSGSGSLFELANNGRTWEQITEISGEISSIDFSDQTGVISTAYNGIVRTTNNGKNWSKVFGNNEDETGYWFGGFDMCFMDDKTVLAVGEFGQDDTYGAAILGSEDSGENWDLIWKYPNPGDDFQYVLRGICIAGSDIWAVGENGMMVKSAGPDSFAIVPADTKLPLHAVFFRDKHAGWIAGGYFYPMGDEDIQSVLLKTIDGGESWQQFTYREFLIHDLFFEDELHGWAVGVDTTDQGIILESFNGGDNWEVQVEDLSASLNLLYARYGQLWAGGNNGLLLKLDGVNSIDQKPDNSFRENSLLLSSFPNPFSETVSLAFTSKTEEKVILKIYDSSGQEIRQLINSRKMPGHHQLNWDGLDNRGEIVSRGVYFCQLQVGNYMEVRKIVFL